ACRVDAQRQIRPDTFMGIAIDDRLRIALGPRAFHSLTPAGRVLPRAECPRDQLLPSMRRLHQPERRGRSSSSLSVGLMTTGCDGSVGVDAAGSCVAPGSLATLIGAGSRTVERRRRTSETLGATGGGSGGSGGGGSLTASAAGGRSGCDGSASRACSSASSA